MKLIRITKDLRVLTISPMGRFGLVQTGLNIKKGEEIIVGEPQDFYYDHQTVKAVKVETELVSSIPVVEGTELYILEKDFDPEYWMCSALIVMTENTTL